jgi:hypothetical protein
MSLRTSGASDSQMILGTYDQGQQILEPQRVIGPAHSCLVGEEGCCNELCVLIGHMLSRFVFLSPYHKALLRLDVPLLCRAAHADHTNCVDVHGCATLPQSVQARSCRLTRPICNPSHSSCFMHVGAV